MNLLEAKQILKENGYNIHILSESCGVEEAPGWEERARKDREWGEHLRSMGWTSGCGGLIPPPGWKKNKKQKTSNNYKNSKHDNASNNDNDDYVSRFTHPRPDWEKNHITFSFGEPEHPVEKIVNKIIKDALNKNPKNGTIVINKDDYKNPNARTVASLVKHSLRDKGYIVYTNWGNTGYDEDQEFYLLDYSKK